MKEVTVVRYDAFAEHPGMGNPCGVVFDADNLTAEEMQLVAKKIGWNETVFLCSSDHADVRIRFFMPGRETTLCGHGTVCALCALMERVAPKEKTELTAETLAGDLHLSYDPATKQVTMQQADAHFEAFEGDVDALLDSIGLSRYELDTRWPIWYGSTGSWTLILPINSLSAFKYMKPDNKRFSQLLQKHPEASVHPITPETFHEECALHGRHFSGAFSGTVEDPVTGTACGVMGAYYLVAMRKLHIGEENKVELQIEQGQDMGRDGKVRVQAGWDKNAVKVEISGSAIPGENFTVEI